MLQHFFVLTSSTVIYPSGSPLRPVPSLIVRVLLSVLSLHVHRSVTLLTQLSFLLCFFVWSFVFARNARSLASGVAVFNEAFVFNGDLSKWDTSKVYHIGQSTCSSVHF